ncbi:hypothetical protein IEQ34_002854 [Dendrobium chrysotoxum]|uniref:FCP1 homology domain-containing protein n=1 Tax=Dendrobium chrysotoxum TaxID=161865 RepID=A0AAV7HFM6_DENCH|nr:hypothetical protein IEQ34_002854 [Dendrobium chrysotoxum]
MGKRRRSVSFREDQESLSFASIFSYSEPGQVEKEVRRKKRVFPLTKSLKHRGNATVSFDCSGVPFPVDKIGAPLQFSKTVPSEREMNPSNQKHFRRARRRRKAKSRVSKIVDDHASPVRVGQHGFTSLDQNRKTSFLPTSSPSKEPSSASFEAAGSCEIPSSEKVDSALDNRKITKTRHCRRSRKRGKGGHCDAQHMAHSFLQPQLDFSSNHSSAIRIPERGNYSENADGIQLPAANKLVLSAEKEKYSLINATLDDSKNVCLPSEVNTDSPNCSDIGKHRKKINMARRQEMKCLRNEVHENHRADTASLPDSIIYKVEKALRNPFRKKLLVLDLNGILCDVVFDSHGSCLPHKRVNMRSVFKRPFLDDFLTFCFERFVVGIWSSRNKNNIIGVINYVMGDSKDRLLFCWFCLVLHMVLTIRDYDILCGLLRDLIFHGGIMWEVLDVAWVELANYFFLLACHYYDKSNDSCICFCITLPYRMQDQSKCTVTGFNTIENRHKPLVLKELIKLWVKEEASLPWDKGEYSPSNTLLVDDSPYKALCNPPHTAIFPFPYDFRDEGDNGLGPGGAIRLYLESIASADDVQEHVKKNSFGQQAITSKDKMWSFYKKIIDKNNSMALSRQSW